MYEYVIECDTEVFLGIRLKRSGQIFIFNSKKSREWLLTEGQMVDNLLFRSYTDWRKSVHILFSLNSIYPIGLPTERLEKSGKAR